jgi:hypothetical protein
MSKKSSTPMTPAAASRIQSHADRTGTNQGFKGRAQSSASKTPSDAPAAKGGGKK